MKYLKIFTDFMDVVEPLSDGSLGRLFRAMLLYARDGTEPALKGREAVAWTVAKQHIDRETAAYKTKVEAAQKGGRHSGEARKRLKALGSQSEPKGTNGNETNQDNDKEKYNDNDKYKYNDNDISFIPEPGPQGLTAEKKETHPSLEEIVQYAQDTHLTVDEQHFFDYYEANGWHIGKLPMRDWKAALRAWARNAPAAPRPAPDRQEMSVGESFKKAMELMRQKEAKQI